MTMLLEIKQKKIDEKNAVIRIKLQEAEKRFRLERARRLAELYALTYEILRVNQHDAIDPTIHVDPTIAVDPNVHVDPIDGIPELPEDSMDEQNNGDEMDYDDEQN